MEKKRTGLEALSTVSGLSKEDIKKIIQEVRENDKKLDSCKGHSFNTLLKSKKKWVCSKCNGSISGTNKHWYEKGIEHGRG